MQMGYNGSSAVTFEPYFTKHVGTIFWT